MSYRRRAGGGRRDTAESAIVEALRAAGCQVWLLSGTGNPDLLVKRGGRFMVFEVKTGPKAKLTANQDAANWPILRSVDDALQWANARVFEGVLKRICEWRSTLDNRRCPKPAVRPFAEVNTCAEHKAPGRTTSRHLSRPAASHGHS